MVWVLIIKLIAKRRETIACGEYAFSALPCKIGMNSPGVAL